MSNTKPNINSVYAEIGLITSLESTIKDSFNKLKSARRLREYYKDSPFANKTIYEQEKRFKKEWWKACAAYQEVKKRAQG